MTRETGNPAAARGMAAPPARTLPHPPMAKSVLIVEDEASIREALAELFEVPSNDTYAAGSLDEALVALRARAYDLIVSDIRLGGKRDGGLQVMAASGLLSPDAVMIVLTAYPDEDNRFASERLGATHFLEKPVDLRTIAGIAQGAGVRTALDAQD